MRAQPTPIRFGVFELDPAAGELRKHGIRIKLHDKPYQILAALLEHPGAVVTRQELQQRLWPGDTFVEFENGLNNAISRLRETLGDSAESPRYIETLPKRGYRFLVAVEPLPASKPMQGFAAQASTAVPAARRLWLRWALAGIVVTVAVAAGIAYRGTSSSPIKSIAVLPFVVADAEAGSADDYIAFGMTEAMIAEFSRNAALKVISQTSVLQYKGARKPLPQIARELGVEAILEGSVVHEGGQVRITVQLIEARSDTHLWAQTYRLEAATVLSRQTELARSIIAELGGVLPASATFAAATPLKPEAQEAYVKGRFFLQKPGKERDLARGYFEQALAAQPDSARVLAAMAQYYLLADSVPPSEGVPKAREFARKALAHDESLADAHVSLAFVYFNGDWDWARTEKEFQRALNLDPTNVRAHRWYALFLSAMGRHTEAEKHIGRALELDPVSILTHDTSAAVWLNARKFDRVLQQAHRIQELDANDPRGFEHRANGYAFTGDFAKAHAAIRGALAASKNYPAYFYQQGFVYALAGDEKAALESIAEARRSAPKDYTPGTFPAVVYGTLGQRDVAYGYLEEAFRTRDSFLVTLQVAPYFDWLQNDPRSRELLRRMNFP